MNLIWRIIIQVINREKINHYAGPTASGKTEMSIALAKYFNTQVISCDSRQFYTEMDIGTAKPSPTEMDGVPHHFISSHSVHDQINAGRYQRLASALITSLFMQHDEVILTGGSGLFIDAIINGLDYMPLIPPQIRASLRSTFATEGLDVLIEDLKIRDPAYYACVDLKNPHRIIRALEVCLSTSQTYTQLRKGHREKKQDRPFKIVQFVLNQPREQLYQRINLRVDHMIDRGLEKEVRELLPLRHLNPLNTVGYTELFEYLDGKHTLEQAIENIKRNSRRYAKRQLTWFRRDPDYHWVDANDFNAIVNQLSI